MKLLRSIAASCLLMIAGFYSVAAPASGLNGFEFIDRDIGEILYTVSMFHGIPIVGDDTVSGRASFRFAGTDFESAFDSFLRAERLYVRKEQSLWTVSKVQLSGTEGSYHLDASDIQPALLVEKISAFFGEEVTFDVLPETAISLHTTGTDAEDFAGAVARQLGREYSVEHRDQRIHLARVTMSSQHDDDLFSQIVVQKEMSAGEGLHSAGETYLVDVRDGAMNVVLEQLFKQAGKQYVFAGDVGVQMKRALFSGKSFSETLALLCSESGLGWAVNNEIYYIIPKEEGRTDSSASGRVWKTYSLAYRDTQIVLPLLQNRFSSVEFIALPDQMQFLCRADDARQNDIAAFLALVDMPPEQFAVELQYIHTADLLAHLPAGINSSQIMTGTSDNMFFFAGSKSQYLLLKELLASIDSPVKQIRYDLLVMQFQKTDDFSWEASLSAKRLQFGDLNNLDAALGSVLSLNVDVVSVFGLKFACSLQNAINENRGYVFADTTLHGVNGGTINFKNTNTYRYRDNNIDPDTGKPIYSGVTREIVSGLKLDVTGWVSGDGMITSKVTASVSRQGVDVSAKTGNPPPTSEKIITTEVRGKSGEPVVLSGLVQDETMLAEERTPLVSKVPIFGWLFKSHKKTNERTEMIIYLVPHCEQHEVFQSAKETTCCDDNEFCNRLIHLYIEEKKDEHSAE